MKSIFDELLEKEQLPSEVRGKVMHDVELIKLSLEMADLFILKAPYSVVSIADTYYSKNQTKNN